jgi:hypothetical protein
MESEQLASVNLLFMFFHKKNLIILSIFPCDSLLGTTKFILKILFPRGILYLFGRPANQKGVVAHHFQENSIKEGTKIFSENNRK